MEKTRFGALWDDFLAEGRLVVTTDDIVRRSGSTVESVRVATADAQRRRRLYSPARGLYVVVPLEYRDWGAPPAEWFVDDLCRHLARKYYVGFLSAAQHHGAAHQAPQEFQVVVDRPISDKVDGPHRMRFFATTKIADSATSQASSPGGMFRVATPETLALDLAEFPKRAGGLSNVATILAELDLDENKLLEGAHRRRRSTARRLGWLLDLAGADLDLAGLHQSACSAEGSPTKLDGRGGWAGRVDERWNILVNVPVEADA